MQHLHPDLKKRIINFQEKMIFTFPLFNSSNDVGISEYSRGAPYKLIQHGPNVGRKPEKKIKRINLKMISISLPRSFVNVSRKPTPTISFCANRSLQYQSKKNI
jgi:hypothetical protein